MSGSKNPQGYNSLNHSTEKETLGSQKTEEEKPFNRIIGIDVARALAVFGMILVNFKIVLGAEGSPWLMTLAGLFDGKAAATFVVLAGVGIALMSKSALENNDVEKIKTIRLSIAKRALFLFIVGISYLEVWPADILHFYGVYMAITLVLITVKEKYILVISALFIFTFPLCFALWDYEIDWNFDTYQYSGLWTAKGFFKNLFFNGFHPVLPWVSFMTMGYWLGKQRLNDTFFVKKVFWSSASAFGVLQVISILGKYMLVGSEFGPLFDTSPMPPLPMYLLNGIAVAFSVISGCILLSKKYANTKIIDALIKTGQLALTFYVAHVLLGMGMVEVFGFEKLGYYSIEFSVTYAILFSVSCVLFALVWKKYKRSGPLEWIMRKLTA